MKINFYALLFLFNLGLYAQNNNCGTSTPNDFVINGGFEQVFNNQYPNSTGQLPRACNWLDNANIATPDYFHRFAQNPDLSLPENPRGDQTVANAPNGGDAYAGFAVQPRMDEYNNPVVYTEIIGTQLQSPLQPGTQYDLSFDVSRAEKMGANPIKIQAYLGPQFAINTEHELPIQQNDPNLLENITFSNNTTGWDNVTFRFTAGAGQNFLYIGGISNTIFQNPNAGGFLPTYYYIDNVSLVVASDCNNESINITTQLPDCNIFENSHTFDICGIFTTSANSSYNLSLNITDLDSSPWPMNIPITDTSNVTTSNGITSGNFCITLNESNFNLNNDYQIDAQINSQINGESCRDSSNNILLPFNSCTQDPCVINTYINGNTFCWDDIGTQYDVEVISDDNSLELQTTDNCRDLLKIAQKIRNKFFTIRIRANEDCPWTVCNIQIDQENETPDYDNQFVYNGDCYTSYERLSNEISVGQIKVFPNPATNKVTVSVDNTKITSIEVYNIYGKPIQTIKAINALTQDIDVNRLSRGYYVLKVTLIDGTVQHKNVILR